MRSTWTTSTKFFTVFPTQVWSWNMTNVSLCFLRCSISATRSPDVEYSWQRIKFKPCIHEALTPCDSHQLKPFLGLLNFCAKFLPNLLTTLAPIYSLLQKRTRWHWGSLQQESFSKAKKLLSANTLLVHHCDQSPLVLPADASPYGVGAVLSHSFPDG